MSEENTIPADTDDLDAFETLMFPKPQEEPVATEVPEVEEGVAEPAPDEPVEPETPEEEPQPEDKPVGKKKNSFQERIDELTEKRKDAERAAEAERLEKEALIKRLDALEKLAKSKEPEAPVTPPVVEGPSPDEVLADGTPKYPLGEFDPSYIRDLTRHTIKQEREASEREYQQKAEIAKAQQEEQALVQTWSAKVEEVVEKTYPDFVEKTSTLTGAFQNIDQNYGNFLAKEIMQMEYGTDVLYHLANNLDEAKAIVASGPANALRRLGRLEARFALQSEEGAAKKLRVSATPEPPPVLNKGKASVNEIPDDTDDLDAFEQKFFKRKR